MAEAKKRRALTGVKPTGSPHIGNYLGAIRPALELAKTHETFLFIADLHALTTQHDPKELEDQTYQVAATWLACGLDPSKTVFYKQSDVTETVTLSWLLTCQAPLGFLLRAHSFKDVEEAKKADMDCGTFSYPLLMAADILLYDADVVPVGKDQKQHLEIAQELARKFNHTYKGEHLKVPEAAIDEAVMTVPGLDGRKMSKSYGNTISLFGTDKELKKRIGEITTDSTEYGRPLNPETDTLFKLYKLFATPAQVAEQERRYRAGRRDPGKPDADFAQPSDNYFGWGDAKKGLYEAVLAELGPARREYARLMADKPYLRKLLLEGAERARGIAQPVLRRVMQAAGVVV